MAYIRNEWKLCRVQTTDTSYDKKQWKNDKFVYYILDALHRSHFSWPRASCHIFYLNKWTNEYSPIESIAINSNCACDPRNLLSKHSNNSVSGSLFVGRFQSFLFLSFFFIMFISFRNSKGDLKQFQKRMWNKGREGDETPLCHLHQTT